MAIVRVVVGSLVAHAAVLVALGRLVDGAPPRRAAPPAPPSLTLVAPPVEVALVAPVEVALLPAPPPAPARAPTSPAAPAFVRARPRGIPTTAVAIATGARNAGPVETTEPAAPGRWTRMRGTAGTGGPDLAVHADVPHAPPAQTAPRATESKLQPHGTEWLVPDLVTTMRVTADGRASFHDKPDIEVHLTLPSLDLKQAAKELGDHLAGWYRDPYAQKSARRYQDMPRHEQAVPGGWDAGAGGDANIDGSIKQPEELERRSGSHLPVAGGSLDITSWLHRKFVGDPYASRKRSLLDGTHEQRAQIRATHERQQLDQSAVIMRDNLERVFREVRDPAERRAALFALWDECAEGEGAVGEAGERARAMVIGVIRARLPAAAEGFSPEEIAALDAQRTSAQHFAPY